ncbi:FMN reductase [Streptomyces sp. RO-S4]|uniref:FMN reductase n=1 Tax=Streptomyces sp. RO-S4 TaxID=2902486 RepID=UPI00208E09C6|nr:FMN reductase [Streptomyces sp. RO-S4]MCO4696107.1 FMN reductase [Streptomyces sp. RO-S4]
MKRRLTVVSAGLRQPSSTRLLADRLTDAARRELGLLGDDADVEVIEVRDHAHDLVNHLIAGYPPPGLGRALDTVARADGLIVVTPTFAASYSGMFKMFVDCLEEPALAGKPVLVAATGGTGRHSLVLEHALRPLFSHLHAVVMPTAVFAAPEDWGVGQTEGPLAARVGRAARELASEVGRREATPPADPYDDPQPFDRLLQGG